MREVRHHLLGQPVHRTPYLLTTYSYHHLVGQPMHDRRRVRAEGHRVCKRVRVLHEEALVTTEPPLHRLVVDPPGVTRAAAQLAQQAHVVPPCAAADHPVALHAVGMELGCAARQVHATHRLGREERATSAAREAGHT
eukprot:scaffold90612_cov28-Phaeocystis_antarctica.AAC.2